MFLNQPNTSYTVGNFTATIPTRLFIIFLSDNSDIPKRNGEKMTRIHNHDYVSAQSKSEYQYPVPGSPGASLRARRATCIRSSLLWIWSRLKSRLAYWTRLEYWTRRVEGWVESNIQVESNMQTRFESRPNPQ